MLATRNKLRNEKTKPENVAIALPRSKCLRQGTDLNARCHRGPGRELEIALPVPDFRSKIAAYHLPKRNGMTHLVLVGAGAIGDWPGLHEQERSFKRETLKILRRISACLSAGFCHRILICHRDFTRNSFDRSIILERSWHLRCGF